MNKKTRRLVKKLLIFIGLLILGRLADYLPDVWWGLIIQIVVYGSALFEGVCSLIFSISLSLSNYYIILFLTLLSYTMSY